MTPFEKSCRTTAVGTSTRVRFFKLKEVELNYLTENESISIVISFDNRTSVIIPIKI
jgi:hypothetical protein